MSIHADSAHTHDYHYHCLHSQGCIHLVTVCIHLFLITAGHEDLHSGAGLGLFGIGHKEEVCGQSVCTVRTDLEGQSREVQQVREVEKLQFGTGLVVFVFVINLAWYLSASCRCPWANEPVSQRLWSVWDPFRC